MLDSTLKLSGVQGTDLSEIIIFEGPGLFTSLRIGYAFAKAYFLKNPDYKLYTINTLDALASTKGKGIPNYIPCLPAQKGEVFYCVFENGKKVSEYLIDTIESLKTNYPNFTIEIFDDFPDAEILYHAFINLKEQLRPVNPHDADPFYLRLPDAYMKRHKKE